MTDEAIKAALGDYDTFWLTVWAEARSEPVEGVIAVMSVIRNRVYGPSRFGSSYKAVCLKPRQFSCWNPGTDANHVKLMQMAGRLVADDQMRSMRVYDEPTRQIQFLAQGIMGGQLMSNIGKADHYLTTDLFHTRPPAWARGQTPLAYKGAHAFFTLG